MHHGARISKFGYTDENYHNAYQFQRLCRRHSDFLQLNRHGKWYSLEQDTVAWILNSELRWSRKMWPRPADETWNWSKQLYESGPIFDGGRNSIFKIQPSTIFIRFAITECVSKKFQNMSDRWACEIYQKSEIEYSQRRLLLSPSGICEVITITILYCNNNRIT